MMIHGAHEEESQRMVLELVAYHCHGAESLTQCLEFCVDLLFFFPLR